MVTQEQLNKIVEIYKYKDCLRKDCEGWENMRANLRYANLSLFQRILSKIFH